jgi:hypothetical protein
MLSVASFGHDVQVRFLFDDRDQTVADNGVVFCDQNADHIRLLPPDRALFVSGIGNDGRVTGSDFLTHVRLRRLVLL